MVGLIYLLLLDFHFVFLQQIVASDNESGDDAEAAFLASLTDKQKKKLLRYSLLVVVLFLCVLLRTFVRRIATEFFFY